MPTVKETFDQMASRFKAANAAGVNKTIQYEIGGDGGEIVVREPPPLAACRFVPGLAEFATAAQVCDHAGAAAFEPELADR